MNTTAFSKTYAGVTVLDLPELEFQKGKIYAVIGANGSGKSTFAKILSGILPADSGTKPLEKTVSVGYLPQKSYAYRMSTRANILLCGGQRRQAEALMDDLQIRHLEKKRADRLSGGETARMALCRLMMKRFDLVLLDEPAAAMDMETTVLAEQCIRRYVQETNCALILVTHSLQQARRLADEVLYFRKGRLAEQGPANRLDQPETPELARFLDFYGVSGSVSRPGLG